MRRTPTFDMPLFITFIVLVGLGIAAVYSASYPKAEVEFDSSFHYAGRQIIFAVIGLVAMLACMFTPLAVLRRLAPGIIGVTLLLLVGVLLVGAAKHGNRAWIALGFFQFQPSEFAKVALVVVLPAFLAKRPWTVKTLRGLLTGPALFFFVPVGLIVLQGDLGTATVVAASCVAMLLIAGARFRFIGVPLLAVLLCGMALVMFSARAERIQAWKDPFNTRIRAAYHPRMSLLAVGSGGLFGRGFCQSRQKWLYLPAAQNDYIVAVIAEEVGLVGMLLTVFVPCVFFVFRGFTIAHLAGDEYTAMVASGCTVMLATQALINLCVVLNIIPSMGINFPFISYGGTSIVASMMMAGLLLNCSRGKHEHDRQDVPHAAQPSPA